MQASIAFWLVAIGLLALILAFFLGAIFDRTVQYTLHIVACTVFLVSVVVAFRLIR